jgi:hypothetical protein
MELEKDKETKVYIINGRKLIQGMVKKWGRRELGCGLRRRQKRN